MTLRNYLIAGAAAIAMALPSLANSQTPAQVTTDLNLRASPGGAQIGVMPRGAQVHIYQCSGSWCQVGYGGATGWASQRYLSTGVAVHPRTRTYAVAPQPRVSLGIDVGPRYRDYSPRHRYGSRYDRRHFRSNRYDNRHYDRGHSGFSFSFGR